MKCTCNEKTHLLGRCLSCIEKAATVSDLPELVDYTPVAWLKNDKVITNEKYKEMNSSPTWGWIIDECWRDATPLYTKEQIETALQHLS